MSAAGYGQSFRFPSQEQGLIVRSKDWKPEIPQDPITITVTILDGDVKISVKYPPNNVNKTNIEDRRIADAIETKIKEGFIQYNKDKQKGAIDI